MKKLVFIFVLIIEIFSVASAEEEKIIEEYVSIYSSELDKATYEGDAKESVAALIPDFDTEDIMKKSVSGEGLFNIKELINRILSLLFGEIQSVLKIMVYVMALSILTAYLSALPEGRSREVTDVAFYGSYIIIAGICTASFLEVVKCGKDAINTMILLSEVIVPVVIASLATSGAIVSASVFQPMLLTIIEIALVIIENIFMPAIMLFASLGIVSCLSDKFNAEKMVQFIGKTIKWGISVLLTIFVGTAGLQSLASSGADGISVKIAKYAASNLIPFVGGILSETVETVMNCSVIIKNAVGITGIILMAAAVTLPIIKISACLIVFRITAALIQPVTDNRIVKCVSGIADSVGLVFGITVSVAVMFIIILTIMLNAGTSVVMLGR